MNIPVLPVGRVFSQSWLYRTMIMHFGGMDNALAAGTRGTCYQGTLLPGTMVPGTGNCVGQDKQEAPMKKTTHRYDRYLSMYQSIIVPGTRNQVLIIRLITIS